MICLISLNTDRVHVVVHGMSSTLDVASRELPDVRIIAYCGRMGLK